MLILPSRHKLYTPLPGRGDFGWSCVSGQRQSQREWLKSEQGFLLVPSGGFEYQLSSQSGVRIAGAYGATITPGNNSKGSYVQIFSALAEDCYGIRININSNFVTTAARDTIVDIGVDLAGGTSYTVQIPDLLGSCAGGLLPAAGTETFGITYYFPLFIPAGATIGARGSVNNATVGTFRVWAQVFGKPRRPDLVKVGQKVLAYGITAGSSTGTAVTSGTASDGTYTSLGTASEPGWWWQVGFGVNDASMSRIVYTGDLAHGDASNKHLIFEDLLITHNSDESQHFGLNIIGADHLVPTSDVLYGRLQCSGTSDSNMSMAAYGVSE